MQIEIKQRGTPDPGQDSLEDRCAWRLGHNERCGIVPNTIATYTLYMNGTSTKLCTLEMSPCILVVGAHVGLCDVHETF